MDGSRCPDSVIICDVWEWLPRWLVWRVRAAVDDCSLQVTTARLAHLASRACVVLG